MYNRLSFYLLLFALVIVFLFGGYYGVAHSREIVLDFLTLTYAILFLIAVIGGMVFGFKGGSRVLLFLHIIFLLVPSLLLVVAFLSDLLESQDQYL